MYSKIFYILATITFYSESGTSENSEDGITFRRYYTNSGYISENQPKNSIKSISKRAATAKKERIWPHGVIPYTIMGNFSGSLPFYHFW